MQDIFGVWNSMIVHQGGIFHLYCKTMVTKMDASPWQQNETQMNHQKKTNRLHPLSSSVLSFFIKAIVPPNEKTKPSPLNPEWSQNQASLLLLFFQPGANPLPYLLHGFYSQNLLGFWPRDGYQLEACFVREECGSRKRRKDVFYCNRQGWTLFI